MHHELSETEARRLLRLPPSADNAALKQSYRRLAREHHPDHGGDPDTFLLVRQAYERLGGEHGTPPPAIVPGRPSRTRSSPPRRMDLATVDWASDPLRAGQRLRRDALAAWLATTGGRGPMDATSRAPRSRLNALAPNLAEEWTSRLSIRSDQREATLVLRGSPRRARRALDGAPLAGQWHRTRSSSATTLRAQLRITEDPQQAAVEVLARLEPMLDALSWPLEAWTCLHAAEAA